MQPGKSSEAKKRPSPVCLHCGIEARGFAICIECSKRLPPGLRKRVTKWYGRDERRNAIAIAEALEHLRRGKSEPSNADHRLEAAR